MIDQTTPQHRSYANRHQRMLAISVCLFVAIVTCNIVTVRQLRAAEESGTIVKAESARQLRQLRSKHLMLSTDLPRSRARVLLDRLEAKLRVVSRYWGRPVARPIECFIVDDLANWTEGTLPDEHTRVILDRIGGYAFRVSAGRETRVVMFATNEPSVPQHELVHAYCLATFPECGPDWYKEGMAEFFSYANDQGRAGVRCRERTIAYLRKSKPRSINDIVAKQRLTKSIAASVIRAADVRLAATSPAEPAWGTSDQAMLLKAQKSYSWSWALCHFLVRNTNYNKQFRKLGQAYLAGEDPEFGDYFVDCRRELETEFHHFASQLNRGYRVDLCRWNWQAESELLEPGKEAQASVHAGRGLQATGMIVASRVEYAFESKGKWQIDRSGPALTSDGQTNGAGQLVGAIFADQQMSEPINLGTSGTFVAPHDGTLYLRCRDAWHAIADNQGSVKVRIKRIDKSAE